MRQDPWAFSPRTCSVGIHEQPATASQPSVDARNKSGHGAIYDWKFGTAATQSIPFMRAGAQAQSLSPPTIPASETRQGADLDALAASRAGQRHRVLEGGA